MVEVFILCIALLLIAFFSGIEIAFVSANKLRVELLKDKSSSARIVSEFNANPSRFISTMLIGLNIGLVLFGSTMSSLLEEESKVVGSIIPKDKASQMLMETIITTIVVLFLGELIPKLLFRINADQMLLTFAYPTKYLFYIPLKPLTDVFHSLSKKVIKLFVGTDYHEGKQSFTQEDLEYLIKESAIEEEEEETDSLNSEIFEKALYLKEEKVKNCMVPRPEIEGISHDESIAELQKKFLETKHSRLLVFEENMDSIIGYVHHFDLLKNPSKLSDIIRPIETVTAAMNAQELLIQLVKERKNIACVVDEYGGTAGIITLEDLMEEIFGEIDDEHDTEELIEKRINENEFVLSGRLEVDYLNEEYNLSIPEGEYSTLSGYIVMNNEEIPDPGEVFFLDNFEIKILKANDKKIELINLKVKSEND